MTMDEPRTYPNGVLSWVDTEQPDPAAAAAAQRWFGTLRERSSQRVSSLRAAASEIVPAA
jgi:hypothetical protein